ncbi:hypothetical protein [Microbacterium panaciterrae]|uniref:Pilus assembly protein n=1 Tax=Microbacterium panaciterrae TaxID=985759 RepID=A0ABP8PVZ5_9MICO
MITRIRRLLRGERGGLEDVPGWAMMCLVAIALISLIALLGRGAAINNTVQAAAFAAARDASLSRGGDAVPHAIAAANTSLSGNVICQSLHVEIGGNGLHTGLGQAGTVSATITCVVSYGDLVFPGWNLPGTFTVTKTEHSPVDPYRER